MYDGDHIRKRVSCPCSKCGKVFYAHCGLDITGNWKRRKAT
jgi:hypothetical protein